MMLFILKSWHQVVYHSRTSKDQYWDNTPPTGLLLLVILALVLSLNSAAVAHKVNVFAYVDVDKLTVEGYFGGKAPAMHCLVELFDGEGKKVLEGQTDEKGTWSVKLSDLPPIKGDLRVVMGAGMGHRAEYTMPAADLAPALSRPRAPQSGASAGQAGPTVRPPAPSVSVTPPHFGEFVHDPAASRPADTEALAARLQRLETLVSNQQKMLMEQKDKGPSLTEIIGGIGWIFGIIGVAAYCMSRKRMAEK